MATANIEALTAAVAQFVGVIDSLYGLYLDAQAGFLANADFVKNAHQQMQRERGPDPRSIPLIIGRGDPNSPSNVTQHQTTQGEFIDRNQRGGRNHVLMARVFIAMLYSYWEVEYRARLATALDY